MFRFGLLDFLGALLHYSENERTLYFNCSILYLYYSWFCIRSRKKRMRTYFSEVSAMKIVIIGAGKVGEELCVSLAAEGNDIVLIEKDPHRLEQLISMADITGIVGNGAIRDTQVEAGVEDCDIFIAVSPHDETNIIGAITAKKIGAPQTIARVRDPEFSSSSTL
jgi:siroheme synthase (precorrin-2 oxidase/ferrochelatase)